MAYTVPTLAEFRTAYPAFGGVADGPVQAAMDRRDEYVDDSWPSQARFTLGVYLVTAHFLYRGGYGPGAAASGGDAPAGLKKRQAGDRMEEFFSPSELGGAASSSGGLAGSPYGAELNDLLRRMFSGPRVY
jgi:hypothetical protein